jgi:hypothetical protein
MSSTLGRFTQQFQVQSSSYGKSRDTLREIQFADLHNPQSRASDSSNIIPFCRFAVLPSATVVFGVGRRALYTYDRLRKSLKSVRAGPDSLSACQGHRRQVLSA